MRQRTKAYVYTPKIFHKLSPELSSHTTLARIDFFIFKKMKKGATGNSNFLLAWYRSCNNEFSSKIKKNFYKFYAPNQKIRKSIY